MTAAEAAAFLRLERKTIYRYVKQGILSAWKPGRKYLFSKKKLQQWLEEGGRHMTTATPPTTPRKR